MTTSKIEVIDLSSLAELFLIGLAAFDVNSNIPRRQIIIFYRSFADFHQDSIRKYQKSPVNFISSKSNAQDRYNRSIQAQIKKLFDVGYLLSTQEGARWQSTE